ncbi:MAG: hypothetical protein V4529_16750 [Gemmatimonadota bacterium]
MTDEKDLTSRVLADGNLLGFTALSSQAPIRPPVGTVRYQMWRLTEREDSTVFEPMHEPTATIGAAMRAARDAPTEPTNE